MNIKGDSVTLRAIEQTDATLLRELINDPETEKMLGGWSYPISQSAQKDWIDGLVREQDVLRCIIETETPGEAIGTVILSSVDLKNGNAEVHLKIANGSSRGKGYGTDAIRAIVSYGFSELRLRCIYANIVEYNEPSVKLFKKCGFELDGVLKERLFKNGKYINILVYSILNNAI
ncbi:MAG: GNAT family N-acetyltransferase [Bacteroidetes bacterium]|mgnify:FL=1|jgi:RimJ/RimL family protein N-acetyltransferase|nr:GNAT family N-acetyltransferase [Bacteroidota bacterium]